MKKIITLCAVLIFSLNPLLSQDKFRVLPSITNLHFGDFYLTGNGPGQIIINPNNPMSSTYYGVEFFDKATITPFTFQIEKLVDEKVTILYQLGQKSHTLHSIGYRPSGVDRDGGWGHELPTVANSQELVVDAPMSVQRVVSGGALYMTFGTGKGIITFKIGATLTVPANSAGGGLFYTSYGDSHFNYWVNWQVIE